MSERLNPESNIRCPTLELSNVTRKFTTDGGVLVEALRGVSLRIHPGEFVAIRGPSGCGKSTLLHVLGCLDRADGGTYTINGKDTGSAAANELASLRRSVFGFVFQNYNLLPDSTALENTALPAIYAGMTPATRRSRAADLLGSLGLRERLHHKPKQLSGGEQQRVAISRALMNGTSVLLADEPTGALDSATGKEIIELLASLSADGHSVILVTHDADVANRADRQLEMLDGRIVRDSGEKTQLQRESQGEVATSHPKGVPKSHADVAEAIRMSLRSLHARPLRTFLTLLGVVIGVAAVVSLLAIGEGAKQRLMEEIDTLGANRLSIWADTRANPGARLTIGDYESIAESVDNLKAVMPLLSGAATLRAGNRDHRTTIHATTADFPLAWDWPIARGVFFDAIDNQSQSAVVVLGETVRQRLFADHQDPIGEYVLIGKVPFLVIGTMNTKGATGVGTADQDDAVLVPLSTGASRLFGQPYLQTIIVSVDDSEVIDETAADIRSLLGARHGVDDVHIRNSVEMQQRMSQAVSTVTLILGAIGAISLLVGGIGVMNIMLVSVTERTREIGIRMAVGARSRDIKLQFIVEAVVITCVGGVIGIFLGVAIAFLASLAITDLRAAFTALPMAAAFVCATAVGLVFGYAPARNAAHLDPAVALSSH